MKDKLIGIGLIVGLAAYYIGAFYLVNQMDLIIKGLFLGNK